jgi:hypothetical protein
VEERMTLEEREHDKEILIQILVDMENRLHRIVVGAEVRPF